MERFFQFLSFCPQVKRRVIKNGNKERNRIKAAPAPGSRSSNEARRACGTKEGYRRARYITANRNQI